MSKKRITREDVAQRAGVSTAVVSYVINDGPRPVSPETREKVEQAIDELGYFPNEVARSLKRKQSLTIGLILPNVNNPVYGEIAGIFEHICMQAGYLVLLCNTGRNPDQEQKCVRMLRAKQVDGVIVMPSQAPRELVAPLVEANIPIIVLEHNLDDLNCVAIDDLEGGRLATQHLINLGHRRIALIRREPTSTTSSQRLVGYRNALESAGIPFDASIVVETDTGFDAGFRAMQHLLDSSDPSPTAVFAHNDVLALGAMHAIRSAGLRIPDDISVVGYDDTAGSAYLDPPLTTIQYPKAEMGRCAAQLVLQLIQDSTAASPKTITLPVELIIRSSTTSCRPTKSSI